MGSWIPFFVVLTALAVVVQAIVLTALFFQLRRTAARVDETLTEINTRLAPILSRVHLLVEDISPRISGIVADASDMTRLARSQAQKMDRVLTEALERLRMQLIHVDQILTGVMETIEEGGTKLKQTVWGPMVKATALVRGIQTGLEFFRSARSGRDPMEPPPSDHRDEGMFI